jgi:branched-chain amino acid aminotransferase
VTAEPRAESWVAIDGVLVPNERAVVSIFDRGFLYGDSVFETVRTYGGAPFMLAEHMERLAWSAERAAMALPLTVADLVGEVVALARDVGARAGGGELTLRVMVTRGEGPMGLDPTDATDPRRIVIVTPFRGLPASAYEVGVEVVTYATHRPSDAARGAKVANYLESILAIRHARASGAHEAIILTGDGCVVEGTTSNVLAVRGDELLSPPDYETLLPGITRRVVMELAPTVGLAVTTRRLEPHDLASADEVFLTSTIREILPVVKIDGHVVGAGRPGPKTRALAEAYRARTTLPAHADLRYITGP